MPQNDKTEIDVDDETQSEIIKEKVKPPSIKEAFLELLEDDDGRMVLRDSEDKEKPLVSIEFSEKAKKMVDDMAGLESQVVAQHMIHSAMQMVMHRQASQFQALVHDEEPKRYS